jgi:CRP-like cAMP-binding protein
MFKRLKLGTKFTLILSLFLVVGVICSSILMSDIARRFAEDNVAQKALVLMETMNSVRTYSNQQITPLIAPLINTRADFIPEVVPTFSTRRVFELLRQNEQYRDLLFTIATLNPTNPIDKADEFEAEIVEKFRNDSTLTEDTGFRMRDGNNLFYVARPVRIQDPTCLRCHSTPEAAPPSQIKTYGSQGGFGWKLNEVVSAQMVYIPSDKVYASYRMNLSQIMIANIIIFTLIILLINWLLKKTVILPIMPMAKLARKISNEQTLDDRAQEPDFDKLMQVSRRSDEMGQLARVFRQMASVVYAREQDLKQQLQQLRSETDRAKKVGLVSNLTRGAYLQQLLERSRTVRNQASLTSTATLLELLPRIPYFERLSPAELQNLMALGQQQRVTQNELICREGETGDYFYIILEGSVDVFWNSLNQHLDTLTTGGFFGEVALLLDCPRMATVRARETTNLLAFDAIGLQILLRDYDLLAEAIKRALYQRQTELDEYQARLQAQGLMEQQMNSESGYLSKIMQRFRNILGNQQNEL